jgi:hypothetical protein
LFLSDIEKWKLRYLYGIKDPSTPAMQLGTNLHKAFSSGETDWLDQCLPFERRIYNKIISGLKNIITLNTEKEVRVDLDGIPTLGYWDGYDKETIIELKTGAQTWSLARAQDHKQLDFYALQHLELYGTIPTILLVSASTKTGKVITHEVKKSAHDIAFISTLIEDTWKTIQTYEPIRTDTSIQS